MKLAFSTLAFPGRKLVDVAAAGSAMGYAGIELRLVDGELIDPQMDASARQRVRDAVARAGLPVVAVDSSIRLTDDNPGGEIERFLELANAWESPVLRVFGGALDESPGRRAEQIRAAAAVLETAVPAAERLGVAIGVETHDSFSASVTVAELLALVPSPSVGAVWDSHHPHRMGETPRQIASNFGDRILLAQVKDARRSAEQDSGWQLVLLGEGEVDVRSMLAELLARHYGGWVSVEWEKRWHPEIEEPEIALPQHIATLQRYLDEINSGEDAPGAGTTTSEER